MNGHNVPLRSVQIATCMETSELVGAAAFSLSPFGRTASGLRGDILVHPSHRNRGVGRALLCSLSSELKRWNVDHFFSWRPPTTSEEQRRLARWGFEPAQELLCFDVYGAMCVPLFEKKLGRYLASSDVIQAIQILPLCDANEVEISGMYARFFAVPFPEGRQRIRLLRHDPIFLKYSRAILIDGVLSGIVVWEGESSTVPVLDLLFVEPSARFGWVALLLLLESYRDLFRDGYPCTKFKCRQDASFPIQLAKLSGATASTETSYVLKL